MAYFEKVHFSVSRYLIQKYSLSDDSPLALATCGTIIRDALCGANSSFLDDRELIVNYYKTSGIKFPAFGNPAKAEARNARRKKRRRWFNRPKG